MNSTYFDEILVTSQFDAFILIELKKKKKSQVATCKIHDTLLISSKSYYSNFLNVFIVSWFREWRVRFQKPVSGRNQSFLVNRHASSRTFVRFEYPERGVTSRSFNQEHN